MTYTELKTYVSSRLTFAGDTDRTAQVDALLNYYYQRFVSATRSTVAEATVTLPLGTQLVTLPANTLHIVSLRGSTGRKLKAVPPEELERLAGEYSGGQLPSIPAFYAWHSLVSCRVWPARTGTADTGAKMLIIQRPTLMSAGSDTPAALDAMHHYLIAEAVIYHMAMTEELWEQVDRSARLLSEEVPAMVAWCAERAGGMLASAGMDTDMSITFPSSEKVRAGRVEGGRRRR